MERKFKTLVKEEHKFGTNEYVLGTINGFKQLVCDGKRNGFDEPGVAPLWQMPGVGMMFTSLCTQEQYDTFAQLVEKHYPGLCEFDYSEE